MTSPSPETLAEGARLDADAAIRYQRRPGETPLRTAARLLVEGIEKRWTPPSGDLEPTPANRAYWAAARARLEEIAGTPKTAPEKPMPPPPPADGPGLAQATRRLLTALRIDECRTWAHESAPKMLYHLLPGGGAILADACPACAVRRALVAEEEQAKVQATIDSPAGGFYAKFQKLPKDPAPAADLDKLRRRALRLWRQRDPDQHVPPVVVAALDEWADAESAETSQ